MKIVIPAAIVFFMWQGVMAQTFELGGQIGYGKNYHDDYLNFRALFGNNTENAYSIGLTGSYIPKQSIIEITTGLVYQNNVFQSSNLNYFRIPIGVDFVFGNKLNFVIGGGIYLSYLFLESGSVTEEFNETKHDFQIGYYFDSGVKYKINEKLSLFLIMKVDGDISPLYQSQIPTHDGTENYENIRSYDYQLLVGFKHLIPGRKNQK